MEITKADNQPLSLRKKLEELFRPSETAIEICPVRDILDKIGDKWSVLIVLQLGYDGPLRFNELGKKISGISQRMLSVTLKALERDGMLNRKLYPTIPPKVEYTLTPLGNSLLEKILIISEWANDHKREIMNNRRDFEDSKLYS